MRIPPLISCLPASPLFSLVFFSCSLTQLVFCGFPIASLWIFALKVCELFPSAFNVWVLDPFCVAGDDFLKKTGVTLDGPVIRGHRECQAGDRGTILGAGRCVAQSITTRLELEGKLLDAGILHPGFVELVSTSNVRTHRL